MRAKMVLEKRRDSGEGDEINDCSPVISLGEQTARLDRGSTCATHKKRVRKEFCSVYPLVMFVDLNEGCVAHEREMCYDFCLGDVEGE
ncbi:hypothetical protein NPIL_218161 [Nephila pilipes]|uniref:Uncharacterized protein n=1 Tax=Nephila pilipes TaxID=299642 RepID=A0A8X6P612_NEPPI|nr:hypothetical protein NPIL_218161 [Nephila pilipes]